jgi:hypothetical protein
LEKIERKKEKIREKLEKNSEVLIKRGGPGPVHSTAGPGPKQ